MKRTVLILLSFIVVVLAITAVVFFGRSYVPQILLPTKLISDTYTINNVPVNFTFSISLNEQLKSFHHSEAFQTFLNGAQLDSTLLSPPGTILIVPREIHVTIVDKQSGSGLTTRSADKKQAYYSFSNMYVKNTQTLEIILEMLPDGWKAYPTPESIVETALLDSLR